MSILKLFLAATFAAVVTLVGVGHASASGNRLGAVNLNIIERADGYKVTPVHYRRYRRYRRHRRHHYRRRNYRHGHYRPYRKRYRYGRRYRHYGYGPSVYVRVPGFGFHFGY